MLNIAIHNLHKLPQLSEPGRGNINGYVLELIKRGYVRYLYFDDYHFGNSYGQSIGDVIAQIRRNYTWQNLGLDKVELIFSPKTLRSKCDILLNFNVTRQEEFTDAIKRFDGLKIFHLMDYFWIEPASKKNERLMEYGVDYVFSYARSDRYCMFFKHYFPNFIGKVIAVPYGFAPRFVQRTAFSNRKKKCVALGSVLPLKRPDAPIGNWLESANFFLDEAWLHKFRRKLILNKERLADLMDSMLPEFPRISDHKYDIVAKFNEYQMFVSCESIFYFPAAKTWEGPAAGCVLVCSDHPCFTDFGFADGINCIKHREYDIDDFIDKVLRYLNDQDKLQEIQKAGIAFVRKNYSHEAIADKLYSIITTIYATGKKDLQEWADPNIPDAVCAGQQAYHSLDFSWSGDFSLPQLEPVRSHPETLRVVDRLVILISIASWLFFVYKAFRYPLRAMKFIMRKSRQLLKR